MFAYSSSKDSLWGHSIRPKVTIKAIHKTIAFLSAYFEPIQPEHLTLNLNPYRDTEGLVPKLRDKAIRAFGRPGAAESLDWIFPPTEYQKVVDFILTSDISPKLPSDPIWLSFECKLVWKRSVLPSFEVPDGVFPDCDEMTAAPLFKVNLQFGGRLMFPMDLLIPISSHDSDSFDFLGRFSADAPMKMNPKHFLILTTVGKKATKAWRKPDADIVSKLQDVIV